MVHVCVCVCECVCVCVRGRARGAHERGEGEVLGAGHARAGRHGAALAVIERTHHVVAVRVAIARVGVVACVGVSGLSLAL